MALLDRAGRVLARIFGFQRAARSQAQKNIAESRLDKIVRRDRDVLRKLQEQQRQTIGQRYREEQLRKLGIVPAPEVERARKLAEFGLEEIDNFLIPPSTAEPAIAEVTPYSPEWIGVSSSNVEKMRWVGGPWGLQVQFRNGYQYEYAVPYTTYLEMLESGSKGRFVWWMRRSGIAYRRWNPTNIPPRIIYRWGHIGGPTDPSQYERPPVGVSRGPTQYRPALGRPGPPVSGAGI